MKKLIIMPLSCMIMACNNQPEKTAAANAANKADSNKKVAAADTGKRPAAKDSLPAKLKKEDMREKLVGIWADTSGNPLFQIDKKTFFYVDNNTGYNYKFIGDSIQVHYDSGSQSFGWKFKGNDILVLTGVDGVTTFYRLKE
jgi:hypothetical protein